MLRWVGGVASVSLAILLISGFGFVGTEQRQRLALIPQVILNQIYGATSAPSNAAISLLPRLLLYSCASTPTNI